MKEVEELTKSVYFCKKEQNTTKSDHIHNIELLEEDIRNYLYSEWLTAQRNIQTALELLEELKEEKNNFLKC